VNANCHFVDRITRSHIPGFLARSLRSRISRIPVGIAVGWSLLGASFLLTGCQTTSRAPAPSRTAAPAAKKEVTPLPSTPSRRTISPVAWKTEAERWIGVKYRKGGQDRTGIDCSGLTARMYQTVAGVNLPRTTKDQAASGNLVSRTDLRPGDLVFFITLKDRIVDHVGIYLGDTKFVHASASKGVVISSLLQDYYAQRYHSARRLFP